MSNLFKEDNIDLQLDRSLKPTSFENFVGQKSLINKLSVVVNAYKKTKRVPEPICLSGISGTGKSSIATVMANELGFNLKTIMSPSIKNIGDLAEVFLKLEEGTILFLDESHSLPNLVQESLYQIMDNNVLSIRSGSNKSILDIKVKPHCMMFATTHLNMMVHPLKNRLGILHHMEYYSTDELTKIVENNCAKLDLKVDSKRVYSEIGARSRGIPRLSNRLIRRVRDFADVYNEGVIDMSCVDKTMEIEQIFPGGITQKDIEYIDTLIYKFSCMPTGINAIAAAMNENIDTIRGEIEPFLVREGYLAYTKRGRQLTTKALKFRID